MDLLVADAIYLLIFRVGYEPYMYGLAYAESEDCAHVFFILKEGTWDKCFMIRDNIFDPRSGPRLVVALGVIMPNANLSIPVLGQFHRETSYFPEPDIPGGVGALRYVQNLLIQCLLRVFTSADAALDLAEVLMNEFGRAYARQKTRADRGDPSPELAWANSRVF